MPNKIDSRTSKFDLKLPKVDEVLVSLNNANIPVNYSIANSQDRWTTYCVWNGNFWELKWEPYKGVAVFLHKNNFEEMINFPYVNRLKVIKLLKRTVIAKVLEW